MSSNQLLLFATKRDWNRILDCVNLDVKMKAYLAGWTEGPDTKSALIDVSSVNVGISEHGNMLLEKHILIVQDEIDPIVRVVPQSNGEIRYSIDQLLNPCSLICCFGGLYAHDGMISGTLSTASTHPGSKNLFKQFKKCILKTCNKIKSYYIGPDAYALLKSGFRLTSQYSSDPRFDLSI